jgi:cyclic pyranopterin phosphate synthase
MKDNYGREINYLRVSVTNCCNLRCAYCVPESASFDKYNQELLSLEELYKVIREFSELGINKIRITGGEPLIRPGVIELVEKVAKLEQIRDLAMTTNGILLKKFAKALKEAGLHRLNISLDSLDEVAYSDITGGGQLKTVLEGMEEARKVGLGPIKINTVLIKGFNDHSIKDFVEWTRNENVEVRFIELMPIGHGIGWAKDGYLSAETVLEITPELKPMITTDSSATATYYQLPGAKGKIGLIKPVSCKFCHNCNRMRLTADGKLKFCLLDDHTLDLKDSLRDGKQITNILQYAIQQKPEKHRLENNQYTTTNMFKIGG